MAVTRVTVEMSVAQCHQLLQHVDNIIVKPQHFRLTYNHLALYVTDAMLAWLSVLISYLFCFLFVQFCLLSTSLKMCLCYSN